jgi:hypothetical protein
MFGEEVDVVMVAFHTHGVWILLAEAFVDKFQRSGQWLREIDNQDQEKRVGLENSKGNEDPKEGTHWRRKRVGFVQEGHNAGEATEESRCSVEVKGRVVKN